MRLSTRHVTGVLAVAFAVAGCGGTESAPIGQGSLHVAAGVAARILDATAPPTRKVGRSWMSPAAKSRDLMYVSDGAQGLVFVYTYPEGKTVGTITVKSPIGMCADAKNNVWVTDEVDHELLEYAHGGTQPIATVRLPGAQAVAGCSFDPVTGDLAITSLCVLSGYDCVSNGSVFVYSSIQKAPSQYFVGTASSIFFCGYDASGDLFIDGNQTSIGPFVLGELVKGASTVQILILNRPVYFPGGVQWDGKYMTVGDQEAGNQIASSVHQFTVNGVHAKIVGTTPLHGASDVVQYWIQGKTIITPNLGVEYPSDARIYPYPAGGAPTTVIGSGTLDLPNGAVVSLSGKQP